MKTAYFAPPYQPDPEKPVEFELRPLRFGDFGDLISSHNRAGIPSTEQLASVFSRYVVNWRGIDAECTPENRASVLRADDLSFGHPVAAWYGWSLAIARHLTDQATLSEIERKN